MPFRYTNGKGQPRFRARWRTRNGERQSRSGFLTENEARAHEEAMRTVRREGRPLRRPKTGLTIDDYWKRWWEEEVTAKARGTQYSYRGTYAAYIGPRIGNVKLRQVIDDPQLLVDWRVKLARDKSQSVLDHAHRVLSSMLSAAAEEDVIPHNPLLLLALEGRRGRARTVARAQPKVEPLAVDLAAWFLVVDYLRRPTRPPVKGKKPRTRRYPLDRERDALIVAIGFMAGYRLPSEALGLTREDARDRRLYMEGRDSAGEYTPGSKTGDGRDMPLRTELAEEFDRVERAYREAGELLGPTDFWVSSRRDGGVWTEHQARNWREREFRPVVRQVASDFPQFRGIRNATPYSTRHSFISCCLQAGISLATIAAWCGTSIQMISETYGRMIRRYEGASPVPLDEQFQTAKAEAICLLADASRSGIEASAAPSPGQNASSSPGQNASHAASKGTDMPPAKRRRVSA
jgi:integrase